MANESGAGALRARCRTSSTRRQEEAGADYEVSLESLSQWQLAWRKFRKHRLAIVGLGILATLRHRGDHRADLPAVRFCNVAAAGRDRRRRPRRRRWPTRSVRPAASSATSSRSCQRRPDVAAHRLLEHAHRRHHRDDRRLGRRLPRRLHRQPAHAGRRRHAQPADRSSSSSSSRASSGPARQRLVRSS